MINLKESLTKERVLGFIDRAVPLLLAGLAAAVPLFFGPWASDFFEFQKQALLLAVTALLLVLWAVKMLLEGRIAVLRTPFDLVVILYGLSVVAAGILSVSPLQSFTDLSTWVRIALPLLFFVAVSFVKTRRQLLNCSMALLLGGGVAAVWTIAQYAIGQSGSLPVWMSGRAFSPVGGIPTLSVFLLVAAVLAGSELVNRQPSTDNRNGRNGRNGADYRLRVAVYGVLVVSLVALLLVNPLTSGFMGRMLKTDFPRPLILDLNTSWRVAANIFRDRPLIGAGPGLYAEVFSQFRPLEFNQSPFWQIRFGAPFNEWLRVMTAAGAVGAAAFALLMTAVLRFVLSDRQKVLGSLAVLTLAASSLVVVWTTPIIFLFFLLLALLAREHHLENPDPSAEVELSLSAIPLVAKGGKWDRESRELLPRVLAPLMILASGLGFFGLGRAYAADIFYKRSLESLGVNQGVAAYNLQQRAIVWNPLDERYRMVYSQTNIALANSLANKEDLSDQDRATINLLIQQAVREARVATRLNPLESRTWESWARIYQNLFGVAANAEDWAASNFLEAARRDPFNPQLRLDLGGVLYFKKVYDRAAQVFAEAVNLKPDYANAHYNLANALREQGDKEGAVAQYQATLSLVVKDSPDWEKVKAELEEAQKGVAAAVGEGAGGELTRTGAGESPFTGVVEEGEIELGEPPASTPSASGREKEREGGREATSSAR